MPQEQEELGALHPKKLQHFFQQHLHLEGRKLVFDIFLLLIASGHCLVLLGVLFVCLISIYTR